MAGSLNKVMLIGNLGADPEIRSFQNGGKVANLRIATSETWKDRNSGERQERKERQARTQAHGLRQQDAGLFDRGQPYAEAAFDVARGGRRDRLDVPRFLNVARAFHEDGREHAGERLRAGFH